MLPRQTYLPKLGLTGFDNITKKKLTVLQGKNKPSQIQLAPDEAGLVFFDAEGFSSIGFGMSGQITDASGNPLGGAKIFTSDGENTKIAVADLDGIYILPDLVDRFSSVIDITIRYNNRIQTERVMLDPHQHNIVDFTFNPPPPPGGTGIISITPPPSPAPPPIEIDLAAGDTVIINTEVTVPKIMPATPTSPPDDLPVRAHILSPGDNMVLTDDEISIQGFINDPTVQEGELIVNGERRSISLTDGEFSEITALRMGNNSISAEFREGGIKGELRTASKNVGAQALAEVAPLATAFGDCLGASAPLTGRPLTEMLSNLPTEIRPSQATITKGEAIQVRASSIFDTVVTQRQPAFADIDQLAAETSRLAAQSLLEQENAALTARVDASMIARSAADIANSATIEAQHNLAVTGQQMARSGMELSGRAADIGYQWNIVEAEADVETAEAAISQSVNDFAGRADIVRNKLESGQVPETSEIQQLLQQQQQLADTIDSLSAQFSGNHQAVLHNIRDISETAALSAQTDRESISTTVEGVADNLTDHLGQLRTSADFQFNGSSTLPAAAESLQNGALQLVSSLQTGTIPQPSLLEGLAGQASSFETAVRSDQQFMFSENARGHRQRIAVQTTIQAQERTSEVKQRAAQTEQLLSETAFALAEATTGIADQWNRIDREAAAGQDKEALV